MFYMSENKRLKEVQKSLGFKSQKEFAEKLNIQQGSLSDIYREKPGVGVSNSIKRILELEYSINVNWIESGEGDMFKNIKENVSPSSSIDKDSLTNIDILVKVIDKLSESDERNSKSIEIMNENMKELIAQGRDQVNNITKLVNLLCQSGVDIANPVIDKEKRGLKTSGRSDRSSATDAEHADVG